MILFWLAELALLFWLIRLELWLVRRYLTPRIKRARWQADHPGMDWEAWKHTVEQR